MLVRSVHAFIRGAYDLGTVTEFEMIDVLRQGNTQKGVIEDEWKQKKTPVGKEGNNRR